VKAKSRALLIVISITVSILIGVACAEAGLAVFFRMKYGSQFTAASWRQLHPAVALSIEFNQNAGCSWPDSLYPHPFLGFVQQNQMACGWPVNNLSLFGQRDLPEDRQPDKFIILILGGSVAHHLAAALPQFSVNRIEDRLRARYVSPNGGAFWVVNGALGAWKQPNQLTMLARYGHRIDAFVSIEGYNEGLAIQGPRDFEEPFQTYLGVSPPPDYPRGLMAFVAASRRVILGSSVLSRSFVASLILNSEIGFATRQIGKVASSSQYARLFDPGTNTRSERQTSRKMAQYLRYLQTIAAVAKQRRIRGALFLQPIPGLYKKLTREEQHFRPFSPALYHGLENLMVQAATNEVRTFSLGHVFENEPETIYGDEIHPRFETDGKSRGYDLMADRIVADLAKAWNLKEKPKHASTIE
jgi:hypothetical protein